MPNLASVEWSYVVHPKHESKTTRNKHGLYSGDWCFFPPCSLEKSENSGGQKFSRTIACFSAQIAEGQNCRRSSEWPSTNFISGHGLLHPGTPMRIPEMGSMECAMVFQNID